MAKREKQHLIRSAPFHWPDWEKIPMMDRYPHSGQDSDLLRDAGRAAYRRLNQNLDAARLAEGIRSFDQVFLQYDGGRKTAVLRQLLDGEDSENIQTLEHYAEEEFEVEALLNAVYLPLVEKEELLDLAGFFGKMLFLRIQNRQVVFDAQLTEALQMEKLLQSQGPQDQGIHAAMLRGNAGIASRDGCGSREDRFYKLGQLRQQMAEQLKLDSFKSLAFLRWERFDYNPDQVLDFCRQIKRYVVQIGLAYRQELSLSGSMELAEQFAQSHLLLPALASLPQLDCSEKDLSYVSKLLDLTLQGIAPNYFNSLAEKSYVHLYLEDDLPPWAGTLLLPQADLPCIVGNVRVTAGELPYILRAAGEAYGYLCTYQDQSFSLLREPSFDMKCVWGEAICALAAPHFSQLFATEDEGERYLQLYLGQTLQRLLWQAMLFEFEIGLEKVMLREREAVEALWQRSIRQYFPDLAEDSHWMRMQRGSYMNQPQLFQQAFSSAGRILGITMGLSLWDCSRKQGMEALNSFETLCTLGNCDGVCGLLAKARFPDPWSEGLVKRLAYQLAYALGY